MKYPRLRRDIQPVPFTSGARHLISFTDPLRLARPGIAIDRRAVPFLRLLDGTRGLEDIQAELSRTAGSSLIPLSELEEFLRLLDDARLLESDGFATLKQEAMDEFAQAATREHCLAGKSYPESPPALAACIRDAEGRIPPPESDAVPKEIRGILAPHIDISVALDAYVKAYRLLEGREYDRVVVLGINHNAAEGLWCVSDKSYDTPFGPLRGDRELVAGLMEELPRGSLAPSDFDHKHEHSVEFQAVFLRHYLGDRPSIVPILCGGIHEFIHEGASPLEDERFLAMKEALPALVRKHGGRTLLVSGVDFSHIGPKFGHDRPAELLMGLAREYDRGIIEALEACDPAGLFAHAAGAEDYCNVCGLPSMLLFSWLLGPCEARLLDQGTYDEQATRSAVTYASMVFYE